MQLSHHILWIVLDSMHTDPVHSARVLVIVQGACACRVVRVVPGACHKSCAGHLSCCAWCLSVPVIQTAVAAGHTWLTCTSTCQLAGRKSNWGDDHCVTLPANAIDQPSKMQNFDSIIWSYQSTVCNTKYSKEKFSSNIIYCAIAAVQYWDIFVCQGGKGLIIGATVISFVVKSYQRSFCLFIFQHQHDCAYLRRELMVQWNKCSEGPCSH